MLWEDVQLLKVGGEIVGGSQREDNLEVILARIEQEGLDPKVFDWYTDLRGLVVSRMLDLARIRTNSGMDMD